MPSPDVHIRQEVLHQKGQAIRAINALLARPHISDTAHLGRGQSG